MFDVLYSHVHVQYVVLQSCVKVIASVCERAAGRSKGGGVTQQQQQQIQRQQSLDQSATTAMVEETLRKDSVSSVDPSLSLADPTDFKFKPPDTSIPSSSSSSHPSLATTATPTAAGSTNSLSFDSFEVNSAQREAEEQLELLMMEDEMSDSLIGSVVPAHTWTSMQSALSNTSKRPSLSGAVGGTSSSTKRPSVSSAAGSKPSQKHSVHVSSVGASTESETNSVRNSTGSSGPDSSVSSGGWSRRASGAAAAAQGGRGAATTAGVGEVRGLQLTVDSKEKERLEDIMAIAQ